MSKAVCGRLRSGCPPHALTSVCSSTLSLPTACRPGKKKLHSPAYKSTSSI